MKIETIMSVRGSKEIQDYYQAEYKDVQGLLIKFLKKEGLIMTELKVKAGFEAIYDNLVAMKAQIEEEVRRTVAEKSEAVDRMIAECTYEEEVVEPEIESAPLEEEVIAE